MYNLIKKGLFGLFLFLFNFISVYSAGGLFSKLAEAIWGKSGLLNQAGAFSFLFFLITILILYSIIFLSLKGKSLFKTNSNALKMIAGVISIMSTLALFMALKEMGNKEYLDRVLAANFIGLMFVIVILVILVFLSILIWNAEFFSKKSNKLQKVGAIIIVIFLGISTFNSVNRVLIYGHLKIDDGANGAANGYLLDNIDLGLTDLFGWELVLVIILLSILFYLTNSRSENTPTNRDLLPKKEDKIKRALGSLEESAEDISKDLIKIQKFLNENKTKLSEKEHSY
jgi:hypothetical protein